MRLNWVVGCACFIASATIAGEIGQAQSQTDQAGGIALQAEASLTNEDTRAAYRHSGLNLLSSSAIVVDQKTGRTLFGKNTDARMPIASITKLMTAMVVLDAQLPLDEKIVISNEDRDSLKGTHSRIKVGTKMSRQLALQLALMSSENRAAAALGRDYPGGLPAFVVAMNRKAASLGMSHTQFVDSTGLNSNNVSTALDLVKMVNAAYAYPLISEMTTTGFYDVEMRGGPRRVQFKNTNMLVRNKTWEIGLSKTGFINEAGHCLVMQANIANRPMVIVLLDSWGKLSRVGDAQRIKKWIKEARVPGTASAS
ncbi:peptidase s11 d-alanyl-d-alanine carboxypeptidase 1 [Sulfuricella denitrificans skB26]|uniref:Peptidase s11 d-alanyl-d-alanine carboxypeptidase 1 n=1 Tax=Sulfuricella denitrificans (strain DSM 22764 / NBRC 105220 / skB26) TaxID=1163617 RepID=S6B1F8_SULDS|nr:D-alanyl-D-alanine endopeptidase [Sulfuricella denitrificans]BAN34532.1 peptidase s11 d-alanyl-d-alanine carboxypeptidase 1 [Sulfuricella denitrificans skB26]